MSTPLTDAELRELLETERTTRPGGDPRLARSDYCLEAERLFPTLARELLAAREALEQRTHRVEELLALLRLGNEAEDRFRAALRFIAVTERPCFNCGDGGDPSEADDLKVWCGECENSRKEWPSAEECREVARKALPESE